MTFLAPRKPVTHASRLTVATVRAESALSSFERAATELEAAAVDADQIALETAVEADRLLTLSGDARAQAAVTRTRAAKIRELLA